MSVMYAAYVSHLCAFCAWLCVGGDVCVWHLADVYMRSMRLLNDGHVCVYVSLFSICACV